MRDKKIKPITPEEINEKKLEMLPDEVIESFNEMIATNWNGTSSRFKQKDAVALILGKMNAERAVDGKVDSQFLFDNHYLDVEDLYRKQGWKVYYDKPAYNETYDAIFEFSKK